MSLWRYCSVALLRIVKVSSLKLLLLLMVEKKSLQTAPLHLPIFCFYENGDINTEKIVL